VYRLWHDVPSGLAARSTGGSAAECSPVIRCNHDDYTRPIVEIWEDGVQPSVPEVVDLAKQRDLKVVSTPALPGEGIA